MTKDLAINGQPIQSNNKKICARCGVPITAANHSGGWEVFVRDEDGKIRTQPICVFCHEEDKKGGEKA